MQWIYTQKVEVWAAVTSHSITIIQDIMWPLIQSNVNPNLLYWKKSFMDWCKTVISHALAVCDRAFAYHMLVSINISVFQM